MESVSDGEIVMYNAQTPIITDKIYNQLIHFDTALDRVVAIQDSSLAKLHTELFEQVWGQTL